MPQSYTPRRQSKRWLDGDCPKGVLAIYDNRGQTADRYTVFYAELLESPGYQGSGAMIGYRGMSANPTAPQGVGMYGEMRAYEVAAYRYRMKHRAAKWSSLPDEVKRVVRRDLEEDSADV